MLSLKHPQIINFVNQLTLGLYPLRIREDSKVKLIVKAPKEILLTAKLNKEFKIYVVSILIGDEPTIYLISAFFDNANEPLYISTPLFKEFSQDYLEILLGQSVDIHFFDEHNYELLGYEASLKLPDKTRALIAKSRFIPFSQTSNVYILNHELSWFGGRNSEDDLNAITVSLTTPLFPDDFVIVDAREFEYDVTGKPKIHHTALEREEPGSYQEREIEKLLKRIFPASNIYLNPLKINDREEIADILVVGYDHILIVQAKDSPNIEKIISNTVTRKRATAKKHLDKALQQVMGAVKYVTSVSGKVNFFVRDREISVNTINPNIRTLVVMKELFLDDYKSYTDEILRVCNKVNTPCIPLEYIELHQHTMNISNEKEFFDAYDKIFLIGMTDGAFPRLRIFPTL